VTKCSGPHVGFLLPFPILYMNGSASAANQLSGRNVGSHAKQKEGSMPRPLIFSATFGAYKLLVCTATLVVSAWSAAYAQSSTSRQIALAGTTSMRPAPQGSDGSQTPEVLDSALND